MCWFSVCQVINDLAKLGQRLIDTFGLIKCLTFGPSFHYFFRTSQINKAKFSSFCRKISIIALLDSHYKYGVWSWWLAVHVSDSNGSIIITLCHKVINFLFITNILLRDFSNIYTFHFVFVNLQISFRRVKKILYLLHIYLNHGYLYGEFNIFRGIFDFLKYGFDHSRYNSLHFLVLDIWPLHGMCFTRGSLTIGQDCSIETFKHRFNNRYNGIFVDLFLSGIWIKNTVETVLNDSILSGFWVCTFHTASLFIFKNYTRFCPI